MSLTFVASWSCLQWRQLDESDEQLCAAGVFSPMHLLVFQKGEAAKNGKDAAEGATKLAPKSSESKQETKQGEDKKSKV